MFSQIFEVFSGEIDMFKLSQQIKEQGDLVRSLKATDPKGIRTREAINTLLNLKKAYQESSAMDNRADKLPSSDIAKDLYRTIEEQGNLVRSLKAANPKSDETKAAISKLLDLKKQYKESSGSEYKPKSIISSQEQGQLTLESRSVEELYKQIEEQGIVV